MQCLKAVCKVALTLLIATPAWAGQVLDVPGTGDSQILLRNIAQMYEQQYPDRQVNIPDSVGSGGGIQAVIDGKAILGRTARPLKDREVDLGVVEYQFARIPVVYVVHPSVTGITNLTLDQIIGIYNGTITNWKQVNGPDHKIYIVNREQGDATRDVLERYIPELGSFKPVGTFRYSSPGAQDAISNHPYTIGYLSLAAAKALNLVTISVEGLDPHSEESGYPYVTPLYVVSKGELREPARNFLRYLRSVEIQAYLRKQGAIPVLADN